VRLDILKGLWNGFHITVLSGVFALYRINYALYEELEAEDPERTREVYR